MLHTTPLIYLLHWCEDLTGHAAATERFTEELLADPRPPPGWLAARQAGARPSGLGLGPGPGLPDPVQVWAWERGEQLQSMFPPRLQRPPAGRRDEHHRGGARRGAAGDRRRHRRLRAAGGVPVEWEWEARRREQEEKYMLFNCN